MKVKEITQKYNVPLIINDRIDIALAIDAEGVHIGQSDMPAQIARLLIGKDKILGVSAANIKEAKKSSEGQCRLHRCWCSLSNKYKRRCNISI